MAAHPNRILVIDTDASSYPQYQRLQGAQTELAICTDKASGCRQLAAASRCGHPFALVIIGLTAGREVAGLKLAEDIHTQDPGIGLIIAGQAGLQHPLISITATPAPWLYLDKPLRIRELQQLASYLIRRWRDDQGLQHSAQRRALQKLDYFDPQTDLPNRSFLSEYLQHVLLHARRHHRQMAVLHVNLDGFKRITDDLGQDTGDALLRELAWRLESVVRDSDCITREQANPLWPSSPVGTADAITRFGDDEFMVLLTEIEGVADPARVGGRLVEQLAQPIHIGDQQFTISTSIGFAVYPDHADNEDLLLRNAALAQQAAKRAGRNICQCYSDQLVKPGHGGFKLKNQLREALGTDNLCLHYQPKIDLAGGELTGCETLLRWRHPQLGPIPPAEFIPVAEQSGFILELGEWVILTVCEQLRVWREEGNADLTVAINISVQQFQDHALVAKISRMLNNAGIAPARLQFEITESILMEESGASVEQLTELRALGCSVAMDDFGTGYSSLSYLKRMPLDVVKIDRSFVRDILNDRDDQVILEAIISMAHQLRLVVVAEGVESNQQCEYLKSVHCDQIQGYVISAPVAAAEFAKQFLAQPKETEMGSE